MDELGNIAELGILEGTEKIDILEGLAGHPGSQPGRIGAEHLGKDLGETLVPALGLDLPPLFLGPLQVQGRDGHIDVELGADDKQGFHFRPLAIGLAFFRRLTDRLLHPAFEKVGQGRHLGLLVVMAEQEVADQILSRILVEQVGDLTADKHLAGLEGGNFRQRIVLTASRTREIQDIHV